MGEESVMGLDGCGHIKVWSSGDQPPQWAWSCACGGDAYTTGHASVLRATEAALEHLQDKVNAYVEATLSTARR